MGLGLVAWAPGAQAQSSSSEAPTVQGVSSREAAQPGHQAHQASVNTPDTAQAEPPDLGAVLPTSRIVWHGFGDVGWHRTGDPGRSNTFSLGQLNLYPTATISDRLSVLAEIVLKGGTDNRIVVDLERVLLRYSFAESLALSVGRYHTAIGYYNTTYHHSSWLQTTIERPLPFAFKGPLPIHDVGLSARGSFTTPALRLEYSAEVGNGRSSLPDTGVQNIQDHNQGKAVNLALAVMPNASANLRMGVSLYRDTHTPLDAPSRTESIVAGYVVYTNSAFELLNEAIAMRLSGGQAASSTTSPAFYSQVSRGFGPWRPYARVEYVKVPVGLTPGVPSGRRTLGLVGIRFDFSEMAALKLEYRRHESSLTGNGNGVAANASFAF